MVIIHLVDTSMVSIWKSYVSSLSINQVRKVGWRQGDDYTPSGFYGLGVIKIMFSSYIIRDGYR